ncbi:MAG TPA: DEAD/DEAH box helicase [Clostridia bacterium]|nr:DEAD/DEAH box helicase [Clostridia bacterium]
MRFEEFSLSKEILKGIKGMGFEETSPIQASSIEPLLEGKDIIGQAQTGTGKTAAFGIPMLELINKGGQVQGLVLVPTRELAIQVSNELAELGKYKSGVQVLPVYGGADIRRQLKALKRGVQIVVGTPGRLMDHLRRKSLKLDNLKMVVLDEADEMFAMGFRDDMKTIMDQTNENKQTCFFSATMGSDIQNFSKLYQKEPLIIRVKHKELIVENIQQHYLEMTGQMKTEILSRIIDINEPELAIVFCNTKRMVDNLVGELSSRGYSADALHGDLKQNQRDMVMNKFRKGTIDILVATDVAARGIDVGNVDIVVNYDLPQDEEYYVHRIGRTARAGKEGKSFTFVVGRDAHKLQEIIKYTKAKMEYMELPTIDDMRETKKDHLKDALVEQLEKKENLKKYNSIVDSLLQEEYGPVEIAAAMMKLFDENQKMRDYEKLDRVDYGKKYVMPRSTRSSRDKSPKRGKNPKRSRRKGSRIFIDKGERDGLNPAAVFAAIKSESDIPSHLIGDIAIMKNFSFVEIPKDYMDQTIKSLDGKKIKNKKVRVEVAGN